MGGGRGEAPVKSVPSVAVRCPGATVGRWATGTWNCALSAFARGPFADKHATGWMDGWMEGGTDGRKQLHSQETMLGPVWPAVVGHPASPPAACQTGLAGRGSCESLGDSPTGEKSFHHEPLGAFCRGDEESRVGWPHCLEKPPSLDERAVAPEAGRLGRPLISLGDGVTASCSHDVPEGSSPRHSGSLRNNKLESSRSLVQRLPGRARPGRAKETLPAPPGCLQRVPAPCKLES